jgi:hypothetical protein
MRTIKKVFTGLVASITLLVVGLVALLTYTELRNAQCAGKYCKLLPGHQQFDSVIWKESLSLQSNSPIRLRMVDDLLFKTNHLAGLSRGQVINLLGEPPKTEYFREFEFVYWLGPERSYFSIDSEWLAVKFSHEGVVDRAQLVRD